jgi:hypothetical protein
VITASYRKRSIAAGNMAEENTSHRDMITEQAATLTSHAVVDSGKNSESTEKRKDSNKTKGKEKTTNSVPYYKLFSFADSLDYLLMSVGAVAAVGSGISMPFMTVIFGDLVDSFGRTTNTKDVIHEVSKVITTKTLIIYIIYIYATWRRTKFYSLLCFLSNIYALSLANFVFCFIIQCLIQYNGMFYPSNFAVISDNMIILILRCP